MMKKKCDCYYEERCYKDHMGVFFLLLILGGGLLITGVLATDFGLSGNVMGEAICDETYDGDVEFDRYYEGTVVCKDNLSNEQFDGIGVRLIGVDE